MFLPEPIALASVSATRPVFMIVMGISLVIFTFRLSAGATGWASRLMIAGGLLLGFGYAILMPSYEAGFIERLGNLDNMRNLPLAVTGHTLKLLAMNGGWFLLGLGLAIHAKIFPTPAPRHRRRTGVPPLQPQAIPINAHESVA